MRNALILTAVLLMTGRAWAVGESVVIAGDVELGGQLREVLCISMECVKSTTRHDATVEVKRGKSGAEFSVMAIDGGNKAKVTAPLNPSGRISASELVAATTEMIKAIESPTPVKKASAIPAKKANAKKPSIRIASRLSSRG